MQKIRQGTSSKPQSRKALYKVKASGQHLSLNLVDLNLHIQ